MLETDVAITFIFREKIANAATDFHITNQAKLNSSEEKEGCEEEDDLAPSFSHHISSTVIGLFLVTSLFLCTHLQPNVKVQNGEPRNFQYVPPLAHMSLVRIMRPRAF